MEVVARLIKNWVWGRNGDTNGWAVPFLNNSIPFYLSVWNYLFVMYMCGVYIHVYRDQKTSGVLAITLRFISWRQSFSLNLELGRWPEIFFNPQSPACTVLRATVITVRIYFFMWVPEIWTAFMFVYQVLLPAEPSPKHLEKTLLDYFLTTYIRRI